MSYRNKTYVAFASEDIRLYRLMEAWRENDKIDFNFYDAHDLFVARDTSARDTIKRRLRERLKNAKQVVLIGSADAKKKGGDNYSFLAHEIDVIQEFDLPVVIANKDRGRNVNNNFIPKPLLDADYYSLSVSFQPKIIKFALDNYAPIYSGSTNTGSHYYKEDIYRKLGL
ncbi:TIR domain-containing protein [Halomonas sp. DWK9]|uniref:TIR domain-containing protein n=1 Tax=Halomonas sp. DWK9 TaxID=3060155 RepID=UPI00287FCBFF|nr:TIR domain-containing protein [Halomonas sp. DWK9]